MCDEIARQLSTIALSRGISNRAAKQSRRNNVQKLCTEFRVPLRRFFPIAYDSALCWLPWLGDIDWAGAAASGARLYKWLRLPQPWPAELPQPRPAELPQPRPAEPPPGPAGVGTVKFGGAAGCHVWGARPRPASPRRRPRHAPCRPVLHSTGRTQVSPPAAAGIYRQTIPDLMGPTDAPTSASCPAQTQLSAHTALRTGCRERRRTLVATQYLPVGTARPNTHLKHRRTA